MYTPHQQQQQSNSFYRSSLLLLLLLVFNGTLQTKEESSTKTHKKHTHKCVVEKKDEGKAASELALDVSVVVVAEAERKEGRKEGR
jgi:hypothetical protein